MPWVDLDVAAIEGNAFDLGYLTDWSNGDGKDGIVILFVSLAAAGLAIPHFVTPSTSPTSHESAELADICDNFMLLCGIGIAAIAGLNLGRMIKYLSHVCENATNSANYCHPMHIIGSGVYITITGGIVLAISAVAGIVNREISQRTA
jgi:hypothetical protein